MTPQEFCYWLQGVFEVGDVKSLDERQVQVIRDHLQLVFTKVTPNRADESADPDTGSTKLGDVDPEELRKLITSLGGYREYVRSPFTDRTDVRCSETRTYC